MQWDAIVHQYESFYFLQGINHIPNADEREDTGTY